MKSLLIGIMLIFSASVFATEICDKVNEVVYTANKEAYIVFSSGQTINLTQGWSKIHTEIGISQKTKLASAAMVGNLTFCIDKENNVIKLKH